MSSKKTKQEIFQHKKTIKAKYSDNKNREAFLDDFQNIDSNIIQLENYENEFKIYNDKEKLQDPMLKKIEEIQNARNNEIYVDFINAFSQSNFFNFDDKEELKKNNLEDNSKDSTNSQLTNDDSFEREISDEEIIIQKDFVNRKRIRGDKN